MSDMLLALYSFKGLKITPVSTGQQIMMQCFEKRPLFSIFKDRIMQWQFHKVKIRCSDYSKKLLSEVTYIVNGKLE